MKTVFTTKTLKQFSYELLHDLEEAMLKVLEHGVSDDWTKWLSSINPIMLSRINETALRNKRTTDFIVFENFKQNLFFTDYIELIIQFANNNNKVFNSYFNEPRDKNYLQQAAGHANSFRNLISHPAGKPIYLSDIVEFISYANIITNTLHLSQLNAKLKVISSNLETAIMDSPYFIEDSYMAVNTNLPNPDYNEWNGLVGRHEIKSAIISDFEQGYNRVIAITGGGGIGKSALAINICNEFTKPTSGLFKHIIWITSKNNFLDYSGILDLNPEYFYNNNYKDFLNQFISGFYGELFFTNLEEVSEEDLEKEVKDIFDSYNRILVVVDNLENIDDPKILEFIKNKIIPPNFVLITSRNGLGEINKTYQLEPLEDDAALLLFGNLCRYYKIDFEKINQKKIKDLLKRTNNYPLVIKWCLSLVVFRKLEIEAAFSELNKPQNALLEFIFKKLYDQLSVNSRKVLHSLTLYKEIPDRNIIAYISELNSEIELMDCIFELERHSLIKQNRLDSKHGIIETLNLLGLAQTFINSFSEVDEQYKMRYQSRIISIEEELERVSDDSNSDFRPAQKLAQSKLLTAFKLYSEHVIKRAEAESLIKEAERLAPRFYIVPFFKALIEMVKTNYDYGLVKQYFIESLTLNDRIARTYEEYGKFLKKHKNSPLEYGQLFLNAFNIEAKIGYGIEAAIAFYEAANYSKSFEIIERIRKLDTAFPRDNQHRFWTSKTILNLSENLLVSDIEKSIEYLKMIAENVEKLGAEKTKEYRLVRAKYLSIMAYISVLQGQKFIANSFLENSTNITAIYKSSNAKSYEIREVMIYNFIIEGYLTLDNTVRNKHIKQAENLISGAGVDRIKLQAKFNGMIRKLKNNI